MKIYALIRYTIQITDRANAVKIRVCSNPKFSILEGKNKSTNTIHKTRVNVNQNLLKYFFILDGLSYVLYFQTGKVII